MIYQPSQIQQFNNSQAIALAELKSIQNFITHENLLSEKSLDEMHSRIYKMSQAWLEKYEHLKHHLISANPVEIPSINRLYFVPEKDYPQRKFLQQKLCLRMQAESTAPMWSLFDMKTYTKDKYVTRIVKIKNRYTEQRFSINYLKKHYLIYSIFVQNTYKPETEQMPQTNHAQQFNPQQQIPTKQSTPLIQQQGQRHENIQVNQLQKQQQQTSQSSLSNGSNNGEKYSFKAPTIVQKQEEIIEIERFSEPQIVSSSSSFSSSSYVQDSSTSQRNQNNNIPSSSNTNNLQNNKNIPNSQNNSHNNNNNNIINNNHNGLKNGNNSNIQLNIGQPVQKQEYDSNIQQNDDKIQQETTTNQKQPSQVLNNEIRVVPTTQQVINNQSNKYPDLHKLNHQTNGQNGNHLPTGNQYKTANSQQLKSIFDDPDFTEQYSHIQQLNFKDKEISTLKEDIAKKNQEIKQLQSNNKEAYDNAIKVKQVNDEQIKVMAQMLDKSYDKLDEYQETIAQNNKLLQLHQQLIEDQKVEINSIVNGHKQTEQAMQLQIEQLQEELKAKNQKVQKDQKMAKKVKTIQKKVLELKQKYTQAMKQAMVEQKKKMKVLRRLKQAEFTGIEVKKLQQITQNEFIKIQQKANRVESKKDCDTQTEIPELIINNQPPVLMLCKETQTNPPIQQIKLSQKMDLEDDFIYLSQDNSKIEEKQEEPEEGLDEEEGDLPKQEEKQEEREEDEEEKQIEQENLSASTQQYLQKVLHSQSNNEQISSQNPFFNSQASTQISSSVQSQSQNLLFSQNAQ